MSSHYPDGLDPEAIEALLCEAQPHWDMPSPVVTSAVLSGTAVQRRDRRMTRRAMGAVVRALPTRPQVPSPAGEVA